MPSLKHLDQLSKSKFHIVSTKKLKPELLSQLQLTGIELTQHNFINPSIEIPGNIEQYTIHKHIVITSKTAVEGWIEIVNQLKIDTRQQAVYCLDTGTRQLASHHNLNVAEVATDAISLAKKIADDKSIKAITFICGNLRRDDLPAFLRANSVEVEELVVYRTKLTPIKIDKPIDSILFFSPSGIDSFLLVNKKPNGIVFCIGQTTANHAAKKGLSPIKVAEQHTAESLVDSVIKYYKTQTIHA